MTTQTMLLPFLSLALSLVAVPAIRRLSLHFGLVDRPGGRKQHDGAVAYGGGIAIFAVFALISVFALPPFENDWAYFLALAMILVTGVVDDKSGVNAALKFFVHFLAAGVLVIAGHTQLLTLGNLLGFGNMGLGWMVVPFSVACVVYIINAINMMDGVDGLAGGKSLIVFLWLMAACAVAGAWDAAQSLGIISGAVLGFLFYNMRHPFRDRAEIFLGDAGSMALGLTIAWYAIHLSQAPYAVMKPVSVAWIIALPIVDAFGLLAMRIREGRPPFDADRRHFHHHFLEAGFSPGRATAIILAYAAFLGAVGFFGARLGVSEPVLGWSWVGLWIAHTALAMKPARFISWLEKIRSR